MNYLKLKQDITYDKIDELFFEFMDKRKIYLICGMNTRQASLIMGVSVEMLNGYALNEYAVLFEIIIHNYRIADAEDFWSQSPRMSIFSVAKRVGYANVIEFMYHFISRHKCIPSVWKRRYGII